MSFLAAHHDPALPIRAEDTPASMTAAEVERLLLQASVMKACIAVPRRLGQDASPEELATDKKRARRVQHVLAQCWRDWSRKSSLPYLATEPVRQQAASLSWEAWWGGHRVYLEQRVIYVATWCFKIDGDARWARSAVVRFQNERRWAEYALR